MELPQARAVATSSNTLLRTSSHDVPCRQCGAPKPGPGLCEACTAILLGSSRKVANKKVDAAEAARLGPQTSFFVMALIVLPVSLAGALVTTSLLHPEYSVARTLLASCLMSVAITTAASWGVLFFALAKTDIVSALLSLRSVTRIYRHSDEFWKTMPKLYFFHLCCLAVSVLLTFSFLFTGTFTTSEVAGMVGVSDYSSIDCHNTDCTQR